MPPEAEYLWWYFSELAAARGGNGFGVNPLSWSEIRAWSETTGTPLTPWEALTLRAMDDAFLAAATAKERKRKH